MKQLLGALLAGLISFNASVAVLPIEDAAKIILAATLGALIAALTAFLAPVAIQALKR